MPHGIINFETGSFTPAQLVAVWAAIPADITFIDADGVVRYYSAYRIFGRTPECLDRDVMECHLPASRPGIERMLSEFASGWKEEALFLTHKDDRPVSVRYVAVRDGDGQYAGCLEIAQWADEVGEPA